MQTSLLSRDFSLVRIVNMIEELWCPHGNRNIVRFLSSDDLLYVLAQRDIGGMMYILCITQQCEIGWVIQKYVEQY